MSERYPNVIEDFAREVRGTNALSGRFDQDRMALYKWLVVDNLQTAVAPCFPVLCSILPENQWKKVFQDYLRIEESSCPSYLQLPGYIAHFLQRHPLPSFPFAGDLAHYEWMELDIHQQEETPPSSDLSKPASKTWVLSPQSRLLAYQYPVDKISKDFLPMRAEPHYYLLFSREKTVEFHRLNDSSYQLLHTLTKSGKTPDAIFRALASMLPHSQLPALKEECLSFILRFAEKGALQMC